MDSWASHKSEKAAIETGMGASPIAQVQAEAKKKVKSSVLHTRSAAPIATPGLKTPEATAKRSHWCWVACMCMAWPC